MTRLLPSCVLAGALAAILSGCWSTSEDDEPPKPPGPFPVMAAHLEGFSSVFAVGDVLIAGQPSPLGLANARDAGVKLVINARQKHEMTFDESSVSRGLGMKYVALPFVPYTLSPDQVGAFIFLINNPDREGKVLVHGSSGDRVAALWAMYEISELDMPPEAAVARARRMGLTSPELIGIIGDFSRGIGALQDG